MEQIELVKALYDHHNRRYWERKAERQQAQGGASNELASEDEVSQAHEDLASGKLDEGAAERQQGGSSWPVADEQVQIREQGTSTRREEREAAHVEQGVRELAPTAAGEGDQMMPASSEKDLEVQGDRCQMRPEEREERRAPLAFPRRKAEALPSKLYRIQLPLKRSAQKGKLPRSSSCTKFNGEPDFSVIRIGVNPLLASYRW